MWKSMMPRLAAGPRGRSRYCAEILGGRLQAQLNGDEGALAGLIPTRNVVIRAEIVARAKDGVTRRPIARINGANVARSDVRR